MTFPVTVIDGSGERVSFNARPDERLLMEGLAEGLGLPHECASGTCGSCKATVQEGEATELWAEAPGRRVCRRRGEILMCQSAAKGPLTVTLRTSLNAGVTPTPAWHEGVLTAPETLASGVGVVQVKNCAMSGWLPGQFALVEVPSVAGPRAYSMIHAAGHGPLAFLIRENLEGGCSPILLSPARSDLPCRIFGPLGRSTFDPAMEAGFFAVAGGSGIAGMLAILEAAVATGHFSRHQSRLFFGLRDAAGAYALDRLEEAVRAAPGLSVTVVLSDGPPDHLPSRFPALRFTNGFVHETALSELDAAPLADDGIVFLAGPPPMVDSAMRGLVIDRDIQPERIRYDRFG